MNNIFKLFSIFFLFLVLIVSSCKKEESILGCTDNLAMNYDLNADEDDNSCLFAYDIAQGTWNIDASCTDVSFDVFGQTIYELDVDSIFPPTAEIKAENNTKKARKIINGFLFNGLFIELRVLIIAQLFFTVTIRYLQ